MVPYRRVATRQGHRAARPCPAIDQVVVAPAPTGCPARTYRSCARRLWARVVHRIRQSSYARARKLPDDEEDPGRCVASRRRWTRPRPRSHPRTAAKVRESAPLVVTVAESDEGEEGSQSHDQPAAPVSFAGLVIHKQRFPYPCQGSSTERLFSREQDL